MDRAALEAAAFGKGGQGMGLWLHQGSAAIQEQQTKFIRLHGTTAVFASLASGLDNILKDNAVAVQGVTAAIATGLFPAVGNIAKSITEFLIKNRDGIAKWAERAGAAITKWVDGGDFERLVDSLSAIAGTIGKVVDWLGPMGTGIAAVTVVAWPLIAAIGTLLGSLGSLAVTVLPYVVSGLSLLGSAISAVGAALVPVGLDLLAMTVFLGPFLLAIGAVAAAGYELYTNWHNLGIIFDDWIGTLDQALGKVHSLTDALELISKLGNPFEAYKLLTNENNGDENAALTPEARARVLRVGAASARPQVNQSTNDARVSIDFSNLPRGARVSTESSSQPVEINMSSGPALVSQ